MKTFFAAAVAALSVVDGVLGELSKPAIHPNLDYLMPGLLKNLKSENHTITPLAAGQLPQDCRDIAKNEGRDPANVRAFRIKYDDCPTPWFFCRETSSPTTMATLVSLYGRVPVHTRQWVRHIILLESFGTTTGAAAYNANGNIAIQDDVTNISVLIHESGHSLDLLHAFPAQPNLSASQLFINAYNKAQGVPDEYARSNQVENVAQQCVVATFDLNVPGGYHSVEPNSGKDQPQLQVVENQGTNAPSAGSGSLLKPGGMCKQRLQNSPITGPGGSSRIAGTSNADATDSNALAPGIAEIAPVEFHTGDSCGMFHLHK